VALGADVDAGADKGDTALHVAAALGFVETLKTLVALGADIHAMSTEGALPLHSASFFGQAEAIKALVALGADKNAKCKPNGVTPLHNTACRNHVKALKVLVALGADIEARTADGATPLHYTAGNGHVEAAAALVALGANKQAETRAFCDDGQTPLQIARMVGHDHMEKVLRVPATQCQRTKPPVRRQPTAEEIANEALVAAAMVEEEERKKAQAAKDKVRRGTRAMRGGDVVECRRTAERHWDHDWFRPASVTTSLNQQLSRRIHFLARRVMGFGLRPRYVRAGYDTDTHGALDASRLSPSMWANGAGGGSADAHQEGGGVSGGAAQAC